jgi:hypothetical protein
MEEARSWKKHKPSNDSSTSDNVHMDQEAHKVAEIAPEAALQDDTHQDLEVEHGVALCNTENPHLDQDIETFCDCFTLGTKWLSLHSTVGCCRGGLFRNSRQAKGPGCGSLQCGRCMWEKENDGGLQCDAIAIGSEETGCFHCKQSVGSITIFDDSTHKSEHFPKYLLNGTRNGWCFNRVARHKDYKRKLPNWTTTAIYASLAEEAARRRKP